MRHTQRIHQRRNLLQDATHDKRPRTQLQKRQTKNQRRHKPNQRQDKQTPRRISNTQQTTTTRSKRHIKPTDNNFGNIYLISYEH